MFVETLVCDVRHLIYAEYLPLQALVALAQTARAYYEDIVKRDDGPLYMPKHWRQVVDRVSGTHNQSGEREMLKRVFAALRRVQFFRNVGSHHRDMNLAVRGTSPVYGGGRLYRVRISCGPNHVFEWTLRVKPVDMYENRFSAIYTDAEITPAQIHAFKEQAAVRHTAFLQKQRERNSKGQKEIRARLKPHKENFQAAGSTIIMSISLIKHLRSLNDLVQYRRVLKEFAKAVPAFLEARDAMDVIEAAKKTEIDD